MKTMITISIHNLQRIGLMAVFVLLASGVYAQHAEPTRVTVTGLVKSDDGTPLPNVNVWRKGSLNEGAVTDPTVGLPIRRRWLRVKYSSSALWAWNAKNM